MDKITIVMSHEFRVTLRRTSFRLITAALPTLAVLGVAGIFIFQAVSTERAPTTTTVGYVDGTGLFTGFREQGLVTFQPFLNREAGVRALLADEIKGLYLIPSDYLETGRVVQVKERRPGIPLDEEGTAALKGFLLDNLLAGQMAPERTDRVRQPVVLGTMEVDAEGQPVEEAMDFGHFFFFLGLGFLIVLSILSVSGYLLQGLNEEKENRIMEVLLSSLTPERLMLGKLLGLGAAGLAQVGVWVVTGLVLFQVLRSSGLNLPQVSLPSVPLILLALLYFGLSYAFVGAIMASLGAVTTSQREASQITFIFALPFVAPMWVLSQLIQSPDSTLAQVLTLIPFTSPLTSLIRVAMNAMQPVDLAISLLVLALATVLSVLLALRLFRTYLLMYGQRPGIRQIARTLVLGRT